MQRLWDEGKHCSFDDICIETESYELKPAKPISAEVAQSSLTEAF